MIKKQAYFTMTTTEYLITISKILRKMEYKDKKR